ncbi:nucleotidyltransferase [Piscinibacter sp. XHJ-5]|uniref:nucleotidyltransferase n=1 Tax=Piscinibacter sp. XHJ-5 TaxID=3037797 RepID=UPI0024532F6D|nr:nucleotidyltransferase [Piscinibacter sp. XHJ-5]
MPEVLHGPSAWDESDAETSAFYREVMQTLNDAGLPFLIGGAFAFACFTGIQRNTKDLDFFIRQAEHAKIDDVLRQAGYRTELAYPHWLAKVYRGDAFIDLIFNSGNGISPVDDEWFEHAAQCEVLGVNVRIAPAEETLWTKAFIMERERYDGADVAHLLRMRGHRLDWPRMLRRFGPHWRVLLSHLVLFGFIYPGEREIVPTWLSDLLIERLQQESRQPPSQARLCAGTLLSREQYLDDIEQQGYQDARNTSASTMTPQDVADWTEAIPGRTESR